jgi:N-acetyl-anhydromuramyl-L-alanine amidase AmpD
LSPPLALGRNLGYKGQTVSRGLITALACAAACALVGASAAHAVSPVKRPALTWVRGDGSYTKASRGRQAITTIVIHATDGGTLGGNVWWLSGGHSHASSHYVVSRDGSIVQLVHLSDIAWHSGNRWVNAHSIGIEHVGETYDPNGFTAAEYRSSARLVAWLVRRYSISVDRAHIIGHSEVPDPNNPLLRGGSDHHTDPGPYWRWSYYLNLVRRFAFPERYELHVATTTIESGETVKGVVPWHVSTRGVRARRVQFLVDGQLEWSDSRRPFAFAGGRGWNTTPLDNGMHVLTVHAEGGRGRTASQRLVVLVHNRDFALTSSALHAWQKVKGTLRIRANVRGATTAGIGLYVDGHVISRDRQAPFTLRWNSRRVHDGRHRITLAAVAIDGRVARRTLPLVVANHPVKKPVPKAVSKPVPAPQVISQTVADGSTLSGLVTWRAHTIGPVAKVEFLVDGSLVGRVVREPWTVSWDTSATADGSHVLTVRALTRSGRAGVATVTVTVSQAPPAAVEQSP